jgi:hypothetical protein
MKGIGEKPWKPVPERHYCIFERQSLRLNIALRAKIEGILVSVLFYDTFVYTSWAIVCFAPGAIPLCWSGGMVVTEGFHSRDIADVRSERA